jgi:hypothetical protein
VLDRVVVPVELLDLRPGGRGIPSFDMLQGTSEVVARG